MRSADRSPFSSFPDENVATALVVLSPHFDDAALAVGALIAARTAAGSPVRVVSVYTEGPPVNTLTGKQRVFGDYATRRREDERALALLGATARQWGLRERIFRSPPLSNPVQLFHTPDRVSAFTELAAVEDSITAVLADPHAMLLAPLGIGNHVDHVEVAVATMRAVMACDAYRRVLFYEDFNALSERWRRRHPVARTLPFAWRDAPGWAAPLAGLEMAAMSLAARGRSSTDFLDDTGQGTDLEWAPIRMPVTGDPEVSQIAAVREYRTQTKVLGGQRQIIAMIRRSHARRGGEVLWQLRNRRNRVPPGAQ